MNLFRAARDYVGRYWTGLQWRKLRNLACDSFSISAPAGLVLLDSRLRVVKANDMMASIVGISAHEMIGRDPTFLVPQIAPSVEPMLRQVSATGVAALNVPVIGETPAKPGITRHWTVSVFPVEEWGAPPGYLGAIVVEITDQLQFQLLAEAERIANMGSWEWNILTGEVMCSANLRRMLNLDGKRTSFQTRELQNLIHPEDRASVREIIKHGLKNRQEYAYQARFMVPGGAERILFTRAMPVSSPLNHPTRRVGFSQDITERVEASRALRESEERYRDIIEHSQDLICTHDLDGRVLWMNDLPARILGYSAEELIGRQIPEMLPADVRYQFQDYIERLKRDGYAQGTMKVKTRSGEKRYWEYRNTLRTDGVSTPVVRGMAHDVTERKRTQDALREKEALVRSLFETAQTLTRTLDLQSILDLLSFQAMTLIGATSACAGLRKEAGFSCDTFFDGNVRHNVGVTWPPGVGIPGWVLLNKKTYVTNDVEHDPLILPFVRSALALQNVLCVPVFDVPKKEVIAFFALHNKARGFTEGDVNMAEGISSVASIAIQNSLAHARVCQKEAELHRLSSRLIASHDDERRRVAVELHEQIAPALSGLSMNLGSLKDLNPRIRPESLQTIDDVLVAIRNMSSELGDLSSSLHPLLLDLTGLRNTILGYARTFSKVSGIEVTAEISEDIGRLRPEEETTVYRVVQEALTNVRQHSGSKTAAIRVTRKSDEIMLEVEDSGKGSPELIKEPAFGLGLGGMMERARQHGGSLAIDNRPGAGFKIRFQFPARTGGEVSAGRKAS